MSDKKNKTKSLECFEQNINDEIFIFDNYYENLEMEVELKNKEILKFEKENRLNFD